MIPDIITSFIPSLFLQIISVMCIALPITLIELIERLSIEKRIQKILFAGLPEIHTRLFPEH